MAPGEPWDRCRCVCWCRRPLEGGRVERMRVVRSLGGAGAPGGGEEPVAVSVCPACASEIAELASASFLESPRPSPAGRGALGQPAAGPRARARGAAVTAEGR